MLALLCCLAAAQLPPAAIHQLAASDLRAVPAEARPTTRYLSLHGVPDAEREQFRTALDLALNGTSLRGDLYRPRLVGGGLLVRLDLRGLGWDRFSRDVELDKLTKLGVKLEFKSARDRELYLDIWEFMGFFEPYFVATDRYRRGWLNPAIVDAVEPIARTRKLVVSAHWLLPRLLLENQDAGYYSQLLVNPPVEADFEARWGVNSKFVAADIRAVHGAAVPKSASVAYNNRELQFLAGGTGWDQHWYSRTLDFAKVDKAEKDVRETPAGKSKHEAREILFSLPNGLMAGALFNGQGKQAAFAPQNVAEDQREAIPGRYYSPTKTIFSYAKCLDCHGESRGLIGFDDNVQKLMVPARQDTGYFVVDYDAKVAARETVRQEEFYRAGLKQKVDLYRDSYEKRVRELTGQDVLAATRNLLRWYDRYTSVYASQMVSPADAGREAGYPEVAARALWKAAYAKVAKGNDPRVVYQVNPPRYPDGFEGVAQLNFLAAGQSIARGAFERTVGEMLRADEWPWDRPRQP